MEQKFIYYVLFFFMLFLLKTVQYSDLLAIIGPNLWPNKVSVEFPHTSSSVGVEGINMIFLAKLCIF